MTTTDNQDKLRELDAQIAKVASEQADGWMDQLVKLQKERAGILKSVEDARRDAQKEQREAFASNVRAAISNISTPRGTKLRVRAHRDEDGLVYLDGVSLLPSDPDAMANAVKEALAGFSDVPDTVKHFTIEGNDVSFHGASASKPRSTGTSTGNGGRGQPLTVNGTEYASASQARNALLPDKAGTPMSRSAIVSALKTAGHTVSE